MRRLTVDPSAATPIWRQIEEGIVLLVADGVFVAGRSVPSVRDLARELRVNPATVSKAYRRLTDAGLLVVRRGEGTFVTEDPERLNGDQRGQRLAGAARQYAATGRALGASRTEAEKILRGQWSPPAGTSDEGGG